MRLYLLTGLFPLLLLCSQLHAQLLQFHQYASTKKVIIFELHCKYYIRVYSKHIVIAPIYVMHMCQYVQHKHRNKLHAQECFNKFASLFVLISLL